MLPKLRQCAASTAVQIGQRWFYVAAAESASLPSPLARNAKYDLASEIPKLVLIRRG